MDATQRPTVLGLGAYVGAVAVAAVAVVRSGQSPVSIALDVTLASIPMVLLACVTWRVVWPRWKLLAKLLVHPALYALLSSSIGHWVVLAAWIHQGLLGLGGHIWFSRKHGFTWYAVEDPERYVLLSKRFVGVSDERSPSSPRS